MVRDPSLEKKKLHEQHTPSHPLTWCEWAVAAVSAALSWELSGSPVLSAQVVVSTRSCQLRLVERVERRKELGVYA